jgi:Spy/CpxP family protein refolding chaperone
MSMRGGSSKFQLLTNPAIENELALTDAQKAQVKTLLDEYRAAVRGPENSTDRESLRSLPPEEQRERFRAMMEERAARSKAATAEYTPKFNAALEEIQTERLQQIYWQMQGINALRDDELASQLNLTAEQREKIAALERPQGFDRNRSESGSGDRRPEGESRGGERGGERGGFNREEMRARMEQRNADIMAVLTPEQQAKFTELKGAEFDLSTLRGDRQGSGRGSRGEGGNRRSGGGDQNRF